MSFILLLAIPAIQPLLRADLTCGYDNVFHLWRAVEVEHLLKEGILFSRWAPDMAHGFGFPLFVFVSPTSAYVAAFFHLVGLSWSWAINATFALGMVLGAIFIFFLARDLFGAWGGLVAAVAYLYAPYQAYEVFNRGSLWEAFAWLFPPLVLWGLHRWTAYRHRAGFLVGVLGLAGLILTHELFAFLFAPLLVAWVLLEGYLARDIGPILRGALLGLLSLGVSAFFWLPGLAERGFVQTERLLGTWVFDYHNNFLALEDLLALPRLVDPALINDWPPKALGLVLVLAALLPLARWRALSRSVRAWVALLLVMALVFALMTLPLSLPLWDHLPLLPYVQFPWRFLGPAVLCLALSTGASLTAGERPLSWKRVAGVALLLSTLVFGQLGWFYPGHCAPPADTSLSGMIAWERQTDTLGTTAKAEYLPLWVHQMPEGAFLQEAYASGGPVVRFDPADLPAGAEIVEAEVGALRADIVIDSPVAFRARYLAFYYPGWRVRIDGELVDIAPSDPEGLIAFDVPAGRCTISVRFGETPLRLLADAISIVSVVLLLLCSLAPLLPCSPAPQLSSSLAPSRLRVLAAVAFLILALKLAVIDRVPNPLRHSNLEPGRLRGVDVSTDVTFDGQFRLLGHDALPEAVPGDNPLTVVTYWQDTVPGEPDYWVGLSLRDEAGLRWHTPGLRPPRWHRVPPAAYLWPPDGYARIAYELDPLPGIPPGRYTVSLDVFDRGSLRPFTAQGAAGHGMGLEVELGQVDVLRPSTPHAVDDVSPQYPASADVGPLRLIGYNLDREAAAPGDPFLLTLFWRAEEAPERDFSLDLRLLDPQGDAAVVLETVPVSGFPTDRWASGDIWRGQHPLRLPADLESGIHRWQLQLCEGVACDAAGAPVDLGILSVDAPERAWQAPPLDVEVDTPLGDVATLLGATIEPPICNPQSAICNLQSTPTLTVTLAWRAEQETGIGYRVFLHLLDPEGGSVAQSDGEPAAWTRPTTGWLPGEVILDQRALSLPDDLPPGDYALVSGFYLLDGTRLTTPDGSDAVIVAILEVQE